MKKFFILTFLLFTVSFLKAQTPPVTFSNNIFKVDGTPFFPIGWYDCYSDTDMIEVSSSGANVVLPYMELLYLADPSQSPYHSAPNLTWYLNRLKWYLNMANSKGLKVIVQIPSYYHKDPANPVDDSANTVRILDDSWVLSILDSCKNSPALLGWYIADEPELHPYLEPYFLIQHWYFLINARDPNHPQFLACGNGYELENYLWRQPRDLRTSGWPFYDVLMQDQYIIWKASPSPSTYLSTFDDYTQSIVHCFEDDSSKTSANGSTMVIVQAYGNGVKPANEPELRDPTPIEIRYQSFSYLFYAQNSPYWNPQCINPGGIMYWRYGVSSSQCKTDVNQFIKYFKQKEFDKILMGFYQNSLIQDNYPSSVQTMAREYSGNLYVFMINRSNNVQNVSYNLRLFRYSTCTDIDANLNISLIPKLDGDFQLNASLNAREVKIYKITGAELYKIAQENKTENYPTEYSLKPNYPNPFNPSTKIEYSLPVTAHVSLKIYDILGKEVATIVDEIKEPGSYSAVFNAQNLSTGIYIYQMKAGGFVSTKQMLLMK